MRCPKCGLELKFIEYSSKEVDTYKENSISPLVIIRIETNILECVKCQIRVEETLPAKHYKQI